MKDTWTEYLREENTLYGRDVFLILWKFMNSKDNIS